MNLNAEFSIDFNLKREFNIVFQPVKKPGTDRKRFLVSVNRLPDYIGENWTKYLIKKLLEMDADKDRFFIRHKGFVDAYRK
ncbi:MAG: hypothetical protein JWR05_3517 [Mucilaginibacter sp.]|nr:hypothetical protein [Mucilaginibacter sp.]